MDLIGNAESSCPSTTVKAQEARNGNTSQMQVEGESGAVQGSGDTLKINQLPLAKPGEDLYVDTYSKSSYWNKKTGLKVTHTPHHAVQDAVSAVSHGGELQLI